MGDNDKGAGAGGGGVFITAESFWSTSNTGVICPHPDCGLRFTTHTTAVVVRCPECRTEFRREEAESTSFVGGHAVMEDEIDG